MVGRRANSRKPVECAITGRLDGEAIVPMTPFFELSGFSIAGSVATVRTIIATKQIGFYEHTRRIKPYA